MKNYFFLSLTIILLLSCNTRQPEWTINAFFDQAFSIIQEHSVKKQEIDWENLRQTVLDSIPRFESNEQVYRAIAYTLYLIDDGHSIFVDAFTPHRLSTDTLTVPKVSGVMLGHNIGYLKLSGFTANDSLCSLYTQNIREALNELDQNTDLSGWIIDLRNHSGGKLSSESMGLAPLFEHSLLGYAYHGNQSFEKVSCTPSYFIFGKHKLDSLLSETPFYHVNKKIAVLVDGKTASAGEFLGLAFKSQKNAKVFGSPTKGKTSHLRLISFKSNAILLLATAYYCDAQKNILDGPIMPDEETLPEETLDRAMAWIKEEQ